MLHYLENHVKSSLDSTIEMKTKFQAYYDRIEPYRGIIETGNQLLDNDEVLCFMARPKSELEMKKWLGQSVWDAKTYHKFKNNRYYIQSYIDYYLHYKDRFNYLLEILDHPETRKWFPYYVNKNISAQKTVVIHAGLSTVP